MLRKAISSIFWILVFATLLLSSVGSTNSSVFCGHFYSTYQKSQLASISKTRSLIEMELPAGAFENLPQLSIKRAQLKEIYKEIFRVFPSVRFINALLKKQTGDLDSLKMLLEPNTTYPFIITGQQMRLAPFRETSVSNVFSKHIFISNYEPVRFAGEMRLDSKGRLHISNSSGTYQPNEYQLNEFVAELRSLLPDLEIISYNDRRPMAEVIVNQ